MWIEKKGAGRIDGRPFPDESYFHTFAQSMGYT
jgi:hypothetical protein